MWVNKIYTYNREELGHLLDGVIPLLFLFKSVFMDNQNSRLEMVKTTVSQGDTLNDFDVVVNAFEYPIGIRGFDGIFDIVLIMSKVST